MPLFTPYDHTEDDWWDNLVAEQLQARMPVIMMATRGADRLNAPNDWNGTMNPRELTELIDAFDRAGIDERMMKVTCFVDTQPCKKHYQSIVGNSNALVDFRDRANVVKTYWNHVIEPWFDTVPKKYWFTVRHDGEDRPLIQFWNFHPSWTKNMQGNISIMLTTIADKFESKYGIRPCYNLPEKLYTAGNQDSTVLSQPDVYGFNNWFVPSTNESWTISEFENRSIGHMVPGYANAEFIDRNASNIFQDPDHFVARNGSDGNGAKGDTLVEGLNAAIREGAQLMSIEGWTDDVEWAGLYRSLDSEWETPNQYINLLKRYNDLRTETLRLEFEGCDAYYDTTNGNSGGKFRRSGNLDIQDKPDGKGWNVGWTKQGEWMEFKDVYLAPGTYKFPIQYAASGTKSVTLSIDGNTVSTTSLPSTGSTSNYDTHNIGEATLVKTGGYYDIRVTINTTGSLNLDWLFIKRVVTEISLKSQANGRYLCAIAGGAETILATKTAIGNWEKFIICDRNGGDLKSGDVVNIQSHNGLFFAAEAAGGKKLEVDRLEARGYEAFTIIKVSGSGVISSGDQVAFQSKNGKYINKDSSDLVDVRGTSIGAAQTFTINFH